MASSWFSLYSTICTSFYKQLIRASNTNSVTCTGGLRITCKCLNVAQLNLPITETQGPEKFFSFRKCLFNRGTCKYRSSELQITRFQQRQCSIMPRLRLRQVPLYFHSENFSFRRTNTGFRPSCEDDSFGKPNSRSW